MPTFAYSATDRSGNVVTGILEAEGKKAVIEKLQKENYFPISVEQRSAARSFEFSLPKRKKSISGGELVNFTGQMTTLLKSGLELDRCLMVLHELTEKEKTKEIIRSIQEAVHSGETLGGAMAKQGDVFSPFYLNMVKAGETGGFLEKVFERLAYYLESRRKLIDSVRSALIYPAVLAAAGFGALSVLTVYVIPKFATIFEGMGGELPASTTFLIWMSNMVLEKWGWILLSLTLFILAVKGVLMTPAGRRKWDSVRMKIPLFGDIYKKTVVAQFSRTLGTLLKSGVPIIQSFGIVKETIANVIVREMLDNIMSSVKEGKSVSAQLRETGFFPSLAVHMAVVGEESGKLDEMMLKMAAIYDEEVETAVKRLITLFEPFMLLVMGCVVAFIVISMLTAIFSINDLPF